MSYSIESPDAFRDVIYTIRFLAERGVIIGEFIRCDESSSLMLLNHANGKYKVAEEWQEHDYKLPDYSELLELSSKRSNIEEECERAAFEFYSLIRRLNKRQITVTSAWVFFNGCSGDYKEQFFELLGRDFHTDFNPRSPCKPKRSLKVNPQSSFYRVRYLGTTSREIYPKVLIFDYKNDKKIYEKKMKADGRCCVDKTVFDTSDFEIHVHSLVDEREKYHETSSVILCTCTKYAEEILQIAMENEMAVVIGAECRVSEEILTAASKEIPVITGCFCPKNEAYFNAIIAALRWSIGKEAGLYSLGGFFVNGVCRYSSMKRKGVIRKIPMNPKEKIEESTEMLFLSYASGQFAFDGNYHYIIEHTE